MEQGKIPNADSSDSAQTRIDRSEMSSIWKDGENERFGLKLDLVKHLMQQREEPVWMACKKKLIEALALDKATTNLKILEIGCGLGIDLLDMARELGKTPHSHHLIGLDLNASMVSFASQYYASEKQTLPGNVTVEFIHADILKAAPFENESFDVIRTDITLQHLANLDEGLSVISRLLKKGGRFTSLEGNAGTFYCKDEFVRSIYTRLLPSNPTGGVPVQLYFKVRDVGFAPSHFETFTIVNNGAAAIRADTDWVKLRGTGAMLVEKKLLTQEECSEYQKRYIEAAKNDHILSFGTMVLQIVTKQ